MIYIDPITQQRIPYQEGTTDLQYDMVGDSAITQETVPVVGPWTDYTGSDLNIDSRAQQQFAGISNLLQDTDAGIRGAKLPPIGEVGQNIQTTRRRQIKRIVTL